MYKRFNLTYWIEYSGGSPTLRIEKETSSRTTNVITLPTNYIDELTAEIDSNRLYARINCGNGNVLEETFWAPFNHRLELLGFKDEELQIQGECNLNSTLDLKTNWIHDTNTIFDTLKEGWGTAYGDTFNQDIFVFNATITAPLACDFILTNWLIAPSPYYANEKLTNANIVRRFYDSIPFSLAQYHGQDPNSVAVAVHIFGDSFPLSFYPTYNEPIHFSDDSILGYDPSNNYGNGTSTPVSQANSRYTAPYTGLYYMSYQFDQITTGVNSIPFVIGVRVYDATNVFQSETFVNVQQTFAGIFYSQIWNLNPVYMETGWYAQTFVVQFNAPFSDWAEWNTPQRTVKWRINVDGAGVIQTVDTTKTYIYKYSFSVPMNENDFQNILNNLSSLFPFQRFGDSSVRKGWIKSLRYNHKNCIADVVLVASKEIQNA